MIIEISRIITVEVTPQFISLISPHGHRDRCGNMSLEHGLIPVENANHMLSNDFSEAREGRQWQVWEQRSL